jgi:hypothetical protein
MSNLIKSGFAIVSVLVLTSLASGEIATDPNGMSQWQGIKEFKKLYLDANVQYCVYAPGQFNLSYPAWDDPTDGLQYVYTYQIYNNITRTGTKPYISYFSVGISGADEQADNIGYLIDDPNHKDPNHFDLAGTKAGWFFDASPYLAYDSISDILYFTSPFSPELDTSTVSGGIYSCTRNDLPSPNPEPTTIVLMGAGLFVLATRKTRNSYKK